MTKTADENLVPMLPKRNVWFREKGKRAWAQRSFTVLGMKKYLQAERAAKPVQLTLQTDVEGFRYVEIVGIDLYLALASAILSVEAILLQMRHFGEVRLHKEEAFDVETDTIFFSSRVRDLRESLNGKSKS